MRKKPHFFQSPKSGAKQFGFNMVLGNGKKLTCCGDEPYDSCELAEKLNIGNLLLYHTGDRNLDERKKAKYDYNSDVVITKDNGAEMLTLSAITSAAIMLTVLALSVGALIKAD